MSTVTYSKAAAVLLATALLLFPAVGSAQDEDPPTTPEPITIPDCSNLPGTQTTAPPGLQPYWYRNGKMRPVTADDTPGAAAVECAVAEAAVEPAPVPTRFSLSTLAGLPTGQLMVPLYRNVTIQGSSRSDSVYPAYPFLRADTDTVTLSGLGGNDRLTGTFGADVIEGGVGSDTLSGSKGNDKVGGGPGNDFLRDESGDDRLVGGAGNDTLMAQDGKGGDVVSGGMGRDVCYADRGDTVFGCERIVRPDAA